jgi:hypothetical protein
VTFLSTNDPRFSSLMFSPYKLEHAGDAARPRPTGKHAAFSVKLAAPGSTHEGAAPSRWSQTVVAARTAPARVSHSEERVSSHGFWILGRSFGAALGRRMVLRSEDGSGPAEGSESKLTAVAPGARPGGSRWQSLRAFFCSIARSSG